MKKHFETIKENNLVSFEDEEQFRELLKNWTDIYIRRDSGI